ncbi:hypothetical protein F0223_21690 [Vibrio coralliilyticus]|uniref:hypothetical protein n=1 Tax=Vibrio coralliilyticus TaxID=190893 RepID=UPI00148CBB07|nr:hypothetical protein [Vibrio coralliilyticus]NOI20840.1 hypothetical protein [Vibrio coralliilyticus]
MFNFNAYCFCPELIAERISDPIFFCNLLIPSTVNSPHHLLLDHNEELWLSYLEQVQNDTIAYQNLSNWDLLLKNHVNKTLYSSVDITSPVDPQDICSILELAPVTCQKHLVTNNNNQYIDGISNLSVHGVSIISESNLLASSTIESQTILYTPSNFYSDMLLALSFVSATRANKLENEHNDHLRDLLQFKGYDIYDQTRLGSSSSRLNIGNLDLIVKHNNNWVTIIEPLRLGSVETSNILLHYNKLIDNYNPLGLVNTHLVVYYTGNPNNFNAFFERYKSLVSDLESTQFNGEVQFGTITNRNSDYQTIRSFSQNGQINGNNFHCTHTCLCFSS